MLPDVSPFRRAALTRSLLAVAVVAATAAIAFPVAAHFASIDSQAVHPATPPPAAPPSSSPVSMQDVGRLALNRVVTVESDRAAQEALGTAWLFDDKGDFVTNAHVVAGSLTVRITDRSAHTLVATVLGSDDANDVAVLRVAGGFAGPALPVRTAVLPELPAPVVDCASSRATGHDDLTVASLSKRGQDVPLEPGEVPAGAGTPSVYHDMLTLTGARVYQGNSGGPVLDAGGQVVGILTLASPNQPESFAIPITRVLAELKQYAAGG